MPHFARWFFFFFPPPKKVPCLINSGFLREERGRAKKEPYCLISLYGRPPPPPPLLPSSPSWQTWQRALPHMSQSASISISGACRRFPSDNNSGGILFVDFFFVKELQWNAGKWITWQMDPVERTIQFNCFQHIWSARPPIHQGPTAFKARETLCLVKKWPEGSHGESSDGWSHTWALGQLSGQ